jgi:alkanesulfonate monooxygenase SsuD/methylene tetrahydromethanopterin reductase-like flavin-dependent oxidoreductase (luciferase family)
VIGWDTHMLGQPELTAGQRADRFREFVEILTQLLRDGSASYGGQWYVADEARSLPGPVQQPRLPLAVAAVGPKGMRLAVEHGDAWITTGNRKQPTPLDLAASVDLVAEQVRRLDDACSGDGRDPASVQRIVSTGGQLASAMESAQSFADALGGYGGAGFTDVVVHWPRPEPPYQGDEARFAAILQAFLT